jgi:alkaline phosphatase D
MPFGYFHAYGHAAQREDIDLALHVGDYIYELKRGAYPSDAEAVPGRVIDPTNEIRSLGDYYQRYASYHTDPNLQELRRLKPLAVVWDDHELVNNTWRDGAQDHDPTEDGPFAPRMAAATKAYFDWMPIRRPEPRGVRVYRTLDWGDLARIVLLDTRFIGRDQQLDYRTTTLTQQLAAGGAEAAAAVAAFRAVLNNPQRTLMGAAQERWFADALVQSKARGQTWQIVAQQIVVGPQLTPQGATGLLPETASDGTRAWITGNEQLAAQGLPWNLDSWDGYPAARTRFLQTCAANAANAVVLAGDSHNCWMNNLPAGAGRMAAVEFAGGSVSSPGFEHSLTHAGPGERERAFQSANPNLAWSDLTNRGYGVLHLTRDRCATEWLAFADVRSPVAGAPQVTRAATEPSASAGPGAWSISA